jgi:predicted DNA-binding protein
MELLYRDIAISYSNELCKGGIIMQALLVRFPDEIYDDLKAVSIAEGRPMAEIVRTCVEDYTRNRPLDEIKELIAAVRSLGPISKEEALKATERVVELDDTPGIGVAKVQMSRD